MTVAADPQLEARHLGQKRRAPRRNQDEKAPDKALRGVLAERLAGLHFTLAWLFAYLALSSALQGPHSAAGLNQALALVTSAAFGILWLLRRRLRFGSWRLETWTYITLAMAAANCLTHLGTTGELRSTLGIIFLAFGAALFVDSVRAMVFTTLGVCCAWMLISIPYVNEPGWVGACLDLAAGSLVAIAGQVGRVRAMRSREGHRSRTQKNALALGTALTQAKQELRLRRRVESSLQESKARKAAILDAALDAIVTLDSQGQVVDFNRCAEKMFGVRRKEIRGLQFVDYFVPHELRDAHRAGFDRYLRTREPVVLNQRLELEGLRSDGTRFPLELAISPIELDGSVAFSAYLRDLTDIVEAKDGLRRAEEEQGRVAREIQENLLVGRVPECEGLSVASRFIACEDVGGDFIDYATSPEGLDIIVGDVMGKGVPAALVGAVVKAAFASRRKATGIEPVPISELVGQVDEEYGARVSEIGRFVTLCYARFDLQTRTLQYVDCGHTKTICVHKDGSAMTLEGVDLPFGILPGETVHERTQELQSGDIFVFYSDGLYEAESPEGDLFGMDRIIQSIRHEPERDLTTILKDLENEVRTFTGEETFQDDYTVVAVRVDEV